MPETLDDLFAAVSADVAARTSAPGGQEAIAASRRRIAGVAVASAVVVLVAALSFTLLGGGGSSEPPPPASPTPTEGLDVGDVAVWYDDAGLHRGDVVEQPAVRVRTRGGPSGLTVVRTGALYIDVGGSEVWFHPWGGEPRVIGHDSQYGAVGDPEGDTAAWFEGFELVVYDTARLREVARVRAMPADPDGGEHFKDGPGIMRVSADSVVWQTGQDVRELVVGSSRPVSVGPSMTSSTDGSSIIDVHGETELWAEGIPDMGALTLRAPGTTAQRFPDLEPRGRLSPDGRYLLAITADPHGAGFVDVETRESFELPGEDGEYYAWIAWSYGSTAMVHLTREGEDEVSTLLTCDAERRRCVELPTEGDVVMPAT